MHLFLYNDSLTVTEIYEERYVRQLSNEGDIYVGSLWETEKTYNLAISNDVNLLVLSMRHSYLNAITTRLNLKSYCDINNNINLSNHKRVICQIEISIIAQAQSYLDWNKQISSLTFANRTSILLICHLRKDTQGIIRILKTGFSELRIKEYYGKSDSEEKVHDFSNVEESWKDVDLVAYIKEGLFQWLLNAKCECLPQELQNREIFFDIGSIIRNKDIPTVRL
ncbi:11559_t:CDS:2 [Funneliformis geosporum]|nr:11559_t:CDS:2 [Funneliformis geosporum]